MTIEQINALQVSDCLDLLLSRLDSEAPTPAGLEAELEVYKSELIAEIERVADLKSRYEALSDKGLIQASGVSNPDLHFKQAVLEASAEAAEQVMIEMESQYHSLLNQLNSDAWLKNRQQAYAEIDDLLLEALAEQAEGRSEKMQNYLLLREEIKLTYPKSI